MPDRATSRRGFLRLGLGKAAAVAEELQPAPWTAGGGVPAAGAPPASTEPTSQSPVVPPVAERPLRADRVLELARAEGLGDRVDDVARHLRVSLRLTEASGSASAHAVPSSWLWGAPPAVPDPAWPVVDGAPMVGLCHLDLEELASAGFGVALGQQGGMTVLAGAEAERGGAPGAVGAAQVAVRADDALGRAFAVCPGARRAVLTPELALPRVWVSSVQDLDLTPGESDAWTRLRGQVATLQRISPFDELDGPGAFHRLRGYADERVDLAPEPDGTWELLLQVTLPGTPIASSWPDGRTRMHLWIRSSALTAGDLADVRLTSR